MKNKFLYLIKNTGLLLISNFASKFLVFLMVPLYTAYLTTTEYGIYDVLYTTIQMVMPILSLNVLDGIMRFAIDNDRIHQQQVFSVGCKYSIISMILVGLVSVGISNGLIGSIYKEFGFFFFLLYAAYILNNFVIQFARGIDDISGISVAGVLGTVVMLLTNIVALVFLDMGLPGYFLAMSLSLAIPALYLFLRDKMWTYCTKEIRFFALHAYETELLKYCLPLIFISLSWHINNVSDRYVVTALCGAAANGIYSVSYKIPAILNAFQTVFIQAWQLSAIKEFQVEEKDQFYSETYNICHTVITIMCSVLILLTRPLSHLLFAKDFYSAWRYVPVLLIYIVFNTLSGIIGGVFSAAKRSKELASTAIIGATVNVVLNFLLVYWVGPIGAAIATVISSVVIWVMRLKKSYKYMAWKINLKKNCIQFALLSLQAFLYIFMESGSSSLLLQLGIIGMITMCSYGEIRAVVGKILQKRG